MSRVIVTGGGAAGMMAAVSAAEQGHQVLLLEQNEKLGKKLFITGKGRCNVTNACEIDKLFENVITNPKFLYSAFYGFDNRKMMALLEKAGCPLKTERGERVFPASDHSSDIIAAMQRLLMKNGVEVRLHTKVQRILIEPFRREPFSTDKFFAEPSVKAQTVKKCCLCVSAASVFPMEQKRKRMRSFWLQVGFPILLRGQQETAIGWPKRWGIQERTAYRHLCR